ncbi:H/ACA ribonucleoprotein complex subunit 3-like [Pteronotus mesoamericanus]|uniref:H/ACA ribonucleoprotein complex subunit 3-like n=1 Tax=Pteronotus mesoamericanus TaxID=1884717 RepID=UPI0023EBD9C2|nr:H/ACA ribonucleoprotein complex subunit 3-like [Pteronotus parnellii mesoamericanus]
MDSYGFLPPFSFFFKISEETHQLSLATFFRIDVFSVIVFLQCYLNEQGDRVYTLKKFDPMEQQTCSACPAQFSPDDKYSRHRITIKKRFKVLMTQQPYHVL